MLEKPPYKDDLFIHHLITGINMYWTTSYAVPRNRLAAFCLGIALFLFSGSAQAQTCSQPSNLSGTPLTPTSIRLSWSGIQGATSYTVQYRSSNTITWTTAPATALTQLTLSGLLPQTVYTWRVRASCSTYSSVATFNTGGSGGNTSCSQPSNLNANPLTANSVSLSWSAISGAFNYTVQYRVSTSAAWITAPTTTATQLTLSGLLPETVYTWRVKASCSTYSSTAVFNTGGSGGNTNCSQPSNLNAALLSASSVSLSWSAIQEAFNYTVQYRLSTSAAWTTTGPVTATQLTLTGLLAGATYQWRVQASCSTYSSIAIFTLSGGSGGGGGGSTSCSAPSNTNTDFVSPTSAQVSWEPQAGALNYTVQYRLANRAAYTTLGTVTTPNAAISGLMPGSEYVWRVKANCSPYGSDVQFSTPLALAGATTGAQEEGMQPADFRLFPNPATTEQVNIVSPAAGQLQLLDATGRLLRSEALMEDRQTIRLSDLSNGVYFVRLQYDNGQMATQRLVVAR
jgi:hypothetical protein